MSPGGRKQGKDHRVERGTPGVQAQRIIDADKEVLVKQCHWPAVRTVGLERSRAKVDGLRGRQPQLKHHDLPLLLRRGWRAGLGMSRGGIDGLMEQVSLQITGV